MADKSVKKYDAVCEQIISFSAQSGQNIGDRLPAERKLTELFGVSRSTVQHALRILNERGMISSVQGSGSYWKVKPPCGTHINLPFVTPNHHNESFLKYISGMECFCNTHNIFLTIHMTNENFENEKAVVEELIQNGHKIIIVYSSVTQYSADFYLRHIKNGIRFIFLNHLPLGVSSDCVCSDNILGGFTVTEELINRGHKRILFFYRSGLVTSSDDRYHGYKAALYYHGISYNEADIFDFNTLDYDKELIKARFIKLFTSKEPPTAAIAVDPGYLNEIIKLTETLTSKPENFEVMLYDKYPIGMKNHYSGGIIQPFYDMGFAAAELAYSRICGNTEAYITKILPNINE